MRRREIDWIRNICILMLFIYHTAVIYTDLGDFYVKSESTNLFSNLFIIFTFSWYMPLLFFLAGASTYFALSRRNCKEYLKEKTKKLLIPFIFGIVALVPPQTYLARVWRGETNVNYIEHMKYFFTNINDFMGFDGGFTPAHLWFIVFLFFISLAGTGIIKILKTKAGEVFLEKFQKVFLSKLGLFWVVVSIIIVDLAPNIGGKGFVTNLLIFVLGYIVYSNEVYLNHLVVKRKKFIIFNVIFSILGITYFIWFESMDLGILAYVIEGILKNSVMITMILVVVSYGIKYLNKNHKILKYLNEATFPVYILHQTILLTIAFYIIPFMLPHWLSMIIIILSSFVISFVVYELCKRVSPFKVLLGIK
ncbi:acyltransferase family protein [Clostridium cadaveris]|uniref:acyltransferase family protein n=1 Tax=Clostridium cadaveris TaxID=1529 RepID=UPI001E31BEC5|nr:acyltransferase family protein [Clostridium cadaveris]UFH66098.1 acyltransferase family protein [Clostridium cadaveris]